MSVKEVVLEAIRKMPDEASYEDILDEIALLAALKRGEEAAVSGQVISHEELKRQVSSWTSK